jgi:hypothetical protein
MDNPPCSFSLTETNEKSLLVISESYKQSFLQGNKALEANYDALLKARSTKAIGALGNGSVTVRSGSAGGLNEGILEGPRSAAQNWVRHDDPLHPGKILLLQKSADLSLLSTTVIFRRMCCLSLQTRLSNGLPCHIKFSEFFDSRLSAAKFLMEAKAHKRIGGYGDLGLLASKSSRVDDDWEVLAYFSPLVDCDPQSLRRAFELLCQHGVCTHSTLMFTRVDTLNLSMFAPPGVDRWLTSADISHALDRFEKFLVFSLSKAYDGVFGELRKRLEQGDLWHQSGGGWDPEFIVWSVEYGLFCAFRVIREGYQPTVLEEKQIDISCPEGVAVLLRATMKAIQLDQESLRVFENRGRQEWQAVGGSIGRLHLANEREMVAPASPIGVFPQRSPGPFRAASPATPNKKADGICANHLATLLKLPGAKTCAFARCILLHPTFHELQGMNEDGRKQLVGTLRQKRKRDGESPAVDPGLVDRIEAALKKLRKAPNPAGRS